MFNVCPNCGEYRADKTILPEGPYAVCPVCDHRHKFLQLPLFILTGASGAGKTTACLALAAQAHELVILESDILLSEALMGPQPNWQAYKEVWLRVCKNISQAGKPVMLCGSAIPEQYESSVERRYFSALHYLALVADDELLAARLRSRPAWRRCSDDDYVNRHVEFNRWLKANAQNTQPAMTLLDVTELTVAETADRVLDWATKMHKKHK